jgi:hypothetical protein
MKNIAVFARAFALTSGSGRDGPAHTDQGLADNAAILSCVWSKRPKLRPDELLTGTSHAAEPTKRTQVWWRASSKRWQ